MAAIALVILTVITRQTSATTVRELWGKKQGLFLTGPGGYMAYLWPHREVCGGESMLPESSAFIGVMGREPRVLRGHSLLVNLKPKSGN